MIKNLNLEVFCKLPNTYEYISRIGRGEVHVHPHLHQLYRMISWQIENNVVEVDPSKGREWINVMEKYLKVDNGSNFEATLPQKHIIELFFSLMQPGTSFRHYDELFNLFNRGSGKSNFGGILFAASILMNMEILPQKGRKRESSTKEFWTVAENKQQAGEVFKPLIRVIESSPIFQQLGYIVKGTGVDLSIRKKSDFTFEAGIRTSEKSKLQGMNYATFVADEIHTYKKTGVLEAALPGMKTDNAFTFVITTGGDVRGGEFDNYMEQTINDLYDEEMWSITTRMPFIYMVENYEDWHLPIEQEKASIHWHEPFFAKRKASMFKKTKSILKLGNDDTEFKTKSLNMSVSGDNAWFNVNDFQYEHNFEFTEEMYNWEWYVGVDPAKKHDLFSVSLVHFNQKENKMYVKNWNFTNTLAYKEIKLQSKFPVTKYKERGELLVFGSRVIDQRKIVEWFDEEIYNKFNIYAIGVDVSGCDKFNELIAEVCGIQRDDRFYFGILQSATTLFDNIKRIEETVLNETLYFNDNFLLAQILNGVKIDAPQNKYTIDNPNKNLLHDAISATVTALAARYKYKKLND